MEKKRAENVDKKILSNCAKLENQVTKDCDININEKLYKIFLEHTKMENKNIVRDLIETFKSHTTQQLDDEQPKQQMKKTIKKKFPNLCTYIQTSLKNEDLIFKIIKGLTEEIEKKVPTKVLKSSDLQSPPPAVDAQTTTDEDKFWIKEFEIEMRNDYETVESLLINVDDFYEKEAIVINHYETFLNTRLNGSFAISQNGPLSQIDFTNQLITKIITSKTKFDVLKLVQCCAERSLVVFKVRNMLKDLKEKLKPNAQSAKTLNVAEW